MNATKNDTLPSPVHKLPDVNQTISQQTSGCLTAEAMPNAAHVLYNRPPLAAPPFLHARPETAFNLEKPRIAPQVRLSSTRSRVIETHTPNITPSCPRNLTLPAREELPTLGRGGVTTIGLLHQAVADIPPTHSSQFLSSQWNTEHDKRTKSSAGAMEQLQPSVQTNLSLAPYLATSNTPQFHHRGIYPLPGGYKAGNFPSVPSFSQTATSLVPPQNHFLPNSEHNSLSLQSQFQRHLNPLFLSTQTTADVSNLLNILSANQSMASIKQKFTHAFASDGVAMDSCVDIGDRKTAVEKLATSQIPPTNMVHPSLDLPLMSKKLGGLAFYSEEESGDRVKLIDGTFAATDADISSGLAPSTHLAAMSSFNMAPHSQESVLTQGAAGGRTVVDQRGISKKREKDTKAPVAWSHGPATTTTITTTAATATASLNKRQFEVASNLRSSNQGHSPPIPTDSGSEPSILRTILTLQCSNNSALPYYPISVANIDASSGSPQSSSEGTNSTFSSSQPPFTTLTTHSATSSTHTSSQYRNTKPSSRIGNFNTIRGMDEGSMIVANGLFLSETAPSEEPHPLHRPNSSWSGTVPSTTPLSSAQTSKQQQITCDSAPAYKNETLSMPVQRGKARTRGKRKGKGGRAVNAGADNRHVTMTRKLQKQTPLGIGSVSTEEMGTSLSPTASFKKQSKWKKTLNTTRSSSYPDRRAKDTAPPPLPCFSNSEGIVPNIVPSTKKGQGSTNTQVIPALDTFDHNATNLPRKKLILTSSIKSADTSFSFSTLPNQPQELQVTENSSILPLPEAFGNSLSALEESFNPLCDSELSLSRFMDEGGAIAPFKKRYELGQSTMNTRKQPSSSEVRSNYANYGTFGASSAFRMFEDASPSRFDSFLLSPVEELPDVDSLSLLPTTNLPQDAENGLDPRMISANISEGHEPLPAGNSSATRSPLRGPFDLYMLENGSYDATNFQSASPIFESWLQSQSFFPLSAHDAGDPHETHRKKPDGDETKATDGHEMDIETGLVDAKVPLPLNNEKNDPAQVYENCASADEAKATRGVLQFLQDRVDHLDRERKDLISPKGRCQSHRFATWDVLRSTKRPVLQTIHNSAAGDPELMVQHDITISSPHDTKPGTMMTLTSKERATKYTDSAMNAIFQDTTIGGANEHTSEGGNLQSEWRLSPVYADGFPLCHPLGYPGTWRRPGMSNRAHEAYRFIGRPLHFVSQYSGTSIDISPSSNKRGEASQSSATFPSKYTSVNPSEEQGLPQNEMHNLHAPRPLQDPSITATTAPAPLFTSSPFSSDAFAKEALLGSPDSPLHVVSEMQTPPPNTDTSAGVPSPSTPGSYILQRRGKAPLPPLVFEEVVLPFQLNSVICGDGNDMENARKEQTKLPAKCSRLLIRGSKYIGKQKSPPPTGVDNEVLGIAMETSGPGMIAGSRKRMRS